MPRTREQVSDILWVTGIVLRQEPRTVEEIILHGIWGRFDYLLDLQVGVTATTDIEKRYITLIFMASSDSWDTRSLRIIRNSGEYLLRHDRVKAAQIQAGTEHFFTDLDRRGMNVLKSWLIVNMDTRYSARELISLVEREFYNTAEIGRLEMELEELKRQLVDFNSIHRVYRNGL